MIWAYQSTLLLQPPVLLGRRLCPFTLGHARLLQTYDSPFMGDGPVTMDELLFAVWVCSQPDFEKAAAALLDRSFERQVKAWGKKAGPIDRGAAVLALQTYIRAYMARPPRWEDDKPAKPRAPWPWLYANALRHYFHVTEAEAWNTPVNKSICDFACMGALLGDDSLLTESEAELASLLQREDAPS